MSRGENMVFCRNCGAPLADQDAQCSQCGTIVGSYYQPVPYAPVQRSSPDDDVGRALGMVAIIIAVIVIVTVILAAVLYVWVMGFGSPVAIEQTPVGSWSSIDTGSTSADLHFGPFTAGIVPTDIMIYVLENGSDIGYLTFTGEPDSATTILNWVDGPAGASAEYTDYNYQGNRINAGDYITLEGLNPDTSYTVEVFHIPSDSVITMAGTSSFTTQP